MTAPDQATTNPPATEAHNGEGKPLLLILFAVAALITARIFLPFNPAISLFIAILSAIGAYSVGVTIGRARAIKRGKQHFITEELVGGWLALVALNVAVLFVACSFDTQSLSLYPGVGVLLAAGTFANVFLEFVPGISNSLIELLRSAQADATPISPLLLDIPLDVGLLVWSSAILFFIDAVAIVTGAKLPVPGRGDTKQFLETAQVFLIEPWARPIVWLGIMPLPLLLLSVVVGGT